MIRIIFIQLNPNAIDRKHHRAHTRAHAAVAVVQRTDIKSAGAGFGFAAYELAIITSLIQRLGDADRGPVHGKRGNGRREGKNGKEKTCKPKQIMRWAGVNGHQRNYKDEKY